MQLSANEKRRFHDEGYLVIRQAVPRVQIETALRAINHSLGQLGMPPDDLPRLRSSTYCPELRNDGALLDLFRCSPLPGAVESLMEPGTLEMPGGVQMALRFPSPPGADPGPPRGHLDGLGNGLNGSETGTYQRGFTALCVVLLSPLRAPFSGNFTVWPGTHRDLEAYLKEHGPEVLANGQPQLPQLPEPVQIIGEPGDAVITHHQLWHTAAPNASPHIRYAAIFRLRHAQVGEFAERAFTDIWHEWAGVREAMAAKD